MNDAVRTAEKAMGLDKQISLHLLCVYNHRNGEAFSFAFRTKEDLIDFAYAEAMARWEVDTSLVLPPPIAGGAYNERWERVTDFCNEAESSFFTDSDMVEIYPTDLITGA